MIDEHIHCYRCGRQIETKVKIAGGKTRDREDIRAASFPVPMMTPDGPGFALAQKAVCAACADEIDAAAARAGAASKLVVPTLQGLPGGPPL